MVERQGPSSDISTNRDERLVCPILVHHALPIGSFHVFLDVHRKLLSPLRTAYPCRRSSWSQSGSIEAIIILSPFIRDPIPCPILILRQSDMDDLMTDKLQLLDRCLKIVDSELYDHLRSKNLSAELYAFPCMLLSLIPLVPLHLSDFYSRPHFMRMHTPTRRGAQTLGVSQLPLSVTWASLPF